MGRKRWIVRRKKGKPCHWWIRNQGSPIGDRWFGGHAHQLGVGRHRSCPDVGHRNRTERDAAHCGVAAHRLDLDRIDGRGDEDAESQGR